MTGNYARVTYSNSISSGNTTSGSIIFYTDYAPPPKKEETPEQWIRRRVRELCSIGERVTENDAK